MAALTEREYWDAASSSFAADALELTILPTEQCNLRCVYCYEKFELGKMSPATVAAVQRLIERRATELRSLKLDWFGGEPLLALDVIEAIAQHALSIAQHNQFLKYTSSATTNGLLLTEPVARRLSECGVKLFHVSLDGPEAAHDQTRSAAGGQKTFGNLMHNLVAIRDSATDLQIELRIHVTPLNFALLDEFVDQLVSTLLYDRRFSAYFFPIVDLGGPQQGNFPVLSGSESSKIVDRLTARMNAALVAGGCHRALSPNDDAFVISKSDGRRIDSRSPYVCYAAKANAWVIRSDGRLAKCTVGFEDERNTVGRLLPDGRLDVAGEKMRLWMRGWTTGDRLDLHCPYERMREDVQSGKVESRG